MEHGARPDVTTHDLVSCLHVAAGYNNLACMKKVLPRVQLDDQDSLGNTILHVAIANGCPDVTLHLLEEGCTVDIPNNFGLSPLDVVQDAKMQDLVEGFLEQRRDREHVDELLEWAGGVFPLELIRHIKHYVYCPAVLLESLYGESSFERVKVDEGDSDGSEGW